MSYSLDYYIWGLNPFGYHLTNLILHTGVSLLVLMVMLLLTGGGRAVSWLTAVVFTTHPILVESVPAIARRQDIIAALFLLLSLVFFIRYLSVARGRQGNWFLLASLLGYTFALGAKEIAIVLPVMVCGYLCVYWAPCIGRNNAKTTATGIAEVVKACVPYAAVTVAYVAWRAHVLGGMGGHVGRSFVPSIVIRSSVYTVKSYFVDLLYPVPLHGAVSGSAIQALSVVSVLVMAVLLVTRLTRKSTAMGVRRPAAWLEGGAFRMLSWGGALLSVAGIIGYPLYSPLLDEVVEQAYDGRGVSFLTAAMQGRGTNSVAHYVDRVEELSLICLFALLSISAAGLLLTGDVNRLKRFWASSDVGRSVAFLSIWLLLPLGLLAATDAFQHRNMYIPVIPFSGILSITFVESARRVVRSTVVRQAGRSSRGVAAAAVGSLLVAGGLMAYLLAFSPVARTYGEWEDSGRITAMILQKVSEAVAELPKQSTVHIYDLPNGIATYEGRIPRAKSVSYLTDYTVQSYLALTSPDSGIEVVAENRTVLARYPKTIGLLVAMGPGHNVAMTIKPDE